MKPVTAYLLVAVLRSVWFAYEIGETTPNVYRLFFYDVLISTTAVSSMDAAGLIQADVVNKVLLASLFTAVLFHVLQVYFKRSG
jgi:hypothetical protein